jgi:hypothetical protein
MRSPVRQKGFEERKISVVRSRPKERLVLEMSHGQHIGRRDKSQICAR